MEVPGLTSKLGEHFYHVVLRWKLDPTLVHGHHTYEAKVASLELEIRIKGTAVLNAVVALQNPKTVRDLLNLLYTLPAAGTPYHHLKGKLKGS